VTGALFVLHERRVAVPIISIDLWARRLIATSNAATLLAGMALIGLTTILPIYVQGVLGRSPITAGLTLTSLVVGWPLAVILSSRLFKYFGIRHSVRVGSLAFPFGAVLLLFLTPHSHPAIAAAASFLMGFGMGLVSITGIVLVQESVEWSMRGSATASIIFSRSLRNTLGAAVLGAILNLGITHYGSGDLAIKLRNLLNEPTGLAQLASSQDVRVVLYHALNLSFWGFLVIAVLAVLSSWLIPVAGKANDAPAREKPSVAARDTLDAYDEASAQRWTEPPSAKKS